ncbi:MAG: zinc metallopeptidase [Bacteroidota bacterium]
MYFIIIGFFALVGMVVSGRLKSKFKKYSQVPMTNGLSGAEVAQKMLDHYNIRDVQIVPGQGFLTDHYNPQTKTISLSPEVYQGRSVSAAAVAAHECGHAVQHAEAYTWLKFRSAMVPVVQLASKAQSFLFIFLIGGFAAGVGGDFLMQIIIISFGITALFSVVTLPVEFDASNRALAWLERSRVATGIQHDGAKDALWWAAMTYVVSALSAITVFLYFFLSRD